MRTALLFVAFMAVALGFAVWNDIDDFESHCGSGELVGFEFID